MKNSRNDRNRTIKFVLPLVGFGLLLAFQNFSPSDRSFLLNPSGKKVLHTNHSISNSEGQKPMDRKLMDPKVVEAYRYADFLNENLTSMTDDEIIGRISDRIFTSIEIARMEEFSQDSSAKAMQSRSQYMEKIARDLEKDSNFQKNVIAHVRQHGQLR